MDKLFKSNSFNVIFLDCIIVIGVLAQASQTSVLTFLRLLRNSVDSSFGKTHLLLYIELSHKVIKYLVISFFGP